MLVSRSSAEAEYEPWLQLWLSSLGYLNYFVSSTSASLKYSYYGVKMSPPLTLQQTWSFMLRQSTLSSITILFTTEQLRSEMFASLLHFFLRSNCRLVHQGLARAQHAHLSSKLSVTPSPLSLCRSVNCTCLDHVTSPQISVDRHEPLWAIMTNIQTGVASLQIIYM